MHKSEKPMTEADFSKRMKNYFSEMFPLPQRLTMTALLYISFITILGQIHQLRPSFFSYGTMVGIWSIFAMLMILRLMDELKDREVDRELFRDRPLPSGRVSESDILISLAVVGCLYLVANVLAKGLFLMGLVVLGYSILMYNFFFMPRILRKYLLLNLATHNPIFCLMLLHLVILFSIQQGLSLRNIHRFETCLLIGMYWSALFAWEISRKIRSREEENAYVTYSQILGRIGAVFVAWVAQTIAFAIGLYFYYTLQLSPVFLTILTVGYAIVVWSYGRFVVKPNRTTSKLKPFVEIYILSILFAGCTEYVILIFNGGL
jgi:4-hydroxybenzoate polyprenyltransferase